MPRSLFGSDSDQEKNRRLEEPKEKQGSENQEQQSRSPSWDEQSEEIADLVARSNAGDDEATGLLFQRFEQYLERWESLLVRKSLDLSQLDIREFLCLYIKDKSIRKKLKARQFRKEVMAEVWRIVGELNHLVTTLVGEDDLKQILAVTFLHCLRKYKPQEDKQGNTIPFFRYFYYRFKMELKTNLTKLTMDPVFSYGFVPLEIENGETIIDIQPSTKEVSEVVGGYIAYHLDLGSHWVSGEDSTFPFNTLLPHERQIIKWHFRDQLRRKEIAEILGCSRVLISSIIKEACEKLQETLADDPSSFSWLDWEPEEES